MFAKVVTENPGSVVILWMAPRGYFLLPVGLTTDGNSRQVACAEVLVLNQRMKRRCQGTSTAWRS